MLLDWNGIDGNGKYWMWCDVMWCSIQRKEQRLGRGKGRKEKWE